MGFMKHMASALTGLLGIPEDIEGPARYTVIRRNISILMLLITVVPLCLMALINYHQYQSALKDEIVDPMKVLINKTKHSFELFLANRLATVRFIASAYSQEELADDMKLNRIFRVLRQEFEGFVDLGLIDASGVQVSYVGPYDLKGKNYADQGWFDQVKVNGVYISNVFLGYRRFPHVVIAVQHPSPSGDSWWVVRATIDTRRFDELIGAMGLDPRSDAFLMNRSGVLRLDQNSMGRCLKNDRTGCLPSAMNRQ